MDPEIKKVVDDLNGSNAENIKIITLGTLYDFIKFAPWSDQDLSNVTQKLLDLLSEYPDIHIRDHIYLNLQEALTRDNNLNVSYESAVLSLDIHHEPSYIDMVLQILALSYCRKYVSVISKYVNHSNARIKERAIKSVDFLDKYGL